MGMGGKRLRRGLLHESMRGAIRLDNLFTHSMLFCSFGFATVFYNTFTTR